MKISMASSLKKTDGLFIFLPEKNGKKAFQDLDEVLKKEISDRFAAKDFEGKKGEILQVFPTNVSAKKVLLVGMGKMKDLIDVRKAAGTAIRKAKKLKLDQVSFMIPDNINPKRVISGAILGNYEFKLGDTKERFTPTQITIISTQKLSESELASEIAISESTNFTRDLINLPPNLLTPKLLADHAHKKIEKDVKISVSGNKEIQKLGMGSLFGVGQGSHEESQLIVLEYHGGKESEKPLALVGKGVCFDSGGYNLKPTNHIEDMKSDMSGAATVLGIFQWIAKTKPKKNVIGVIGAVENLVSGNAYKPGDIVTAMNGQTIEITNTDAEGRLVLADCLHYVTTKFKPAQIIDIATLTGACIAALGYEITGIMGNDKTLLDQVKKSAKSCDEQVWELPITDLFREKVKGENSDLLNWTAGVSAGSSMGGAFLEGFVKKTPWVHLDMGGTAFNGKAGNELSPKGATGAMMRTLKGMIE